MFRMQLEIKDAEGLGLVLDRVLRIDGVTVYGLMMVAAPPKIAAASKDTTRRGTPRKQRAAGESHQIILDIIKRTFGNGEEFQPKQITALVAQKGIGQGNFYTHMYAMAEKGLVLRPREGFYRLPTEGQANEETAEGGKEARDASLGGRLRGKANPKHAQGKQGVANRAGKGSGGDLPAGAEI